MKSVKARPLPFRVLEADAGVHPIRTRMPFRYGNACLTVSPVLVVRVTIESADGRRARGFSSDCLPPRWFDKDPDKDYRRNVVDQVTAYRRARDVWLAGGAELRSAFEHWSEGFDGIRAACEEEGINALTASFGSSFFERATLDALCRLAGVPLFEALRHDMTGLETSRELPERPLARIGCRHTVGLADPLRREDVPPQERLDDGLPQPLDECIEFYGLRFFKVKVNGEHDRDLERLGRMARLFAERCSGGYAISLDGNEQYRDLRELERLLEALRSLPDGNAFVENILYIEQPLARDLALGADAEGGVRRLSALRPVIIDESDDLPESFGRAVELGYRGCSHKNSKGIFKSLRNRALASRLNREAGEERYFLTAEDLANTPVIPLQEDLATLVALGIGHAERNGHHYFRGLDHLPPEEARSALAAHPDLYRESGGSVFLDVQDGWIRCGSLQCAGYGYAADIAFESRTPLGEWTFEELGAE